MHRHQIIMKLVTIICTIVILTGLLTGCSQDGENSDMVKYKGTKYVPLEYPTNIFYYYYNGNDSDHFEEVDGIYPIESPQWKMIWNGGDLYCDTKTAEDAILYYAQEDHYDWYVVFDSEEVLPPVSVEISEADAEEVYAIEELEKDTAAFFEEFQAMGSLIKISKDGMVRGTISIVKYDNYWYWNTETIDDSITRDGTWPEYIQPLPDSVNDMIQAAEPF